MLTSRTLLLGPDGRAGPLGAPVPPGAVPSRAGADRVPVPGPPRRAGHRAGRASPGLLPRAHRARIPGRRARVHAGLGARPIWIARGGSAARAHPRARDALRALGRLLGRVQVRARDPGAARRVPPRARAHAVRLLRSRPALRAGRATGPSRPSGASRGAPPGGLPVGSVEDSAYFPRFLAAVALARVRRARHRGPPARCRVVPVCDAVVPRGV